MELMNDKQLVLLLNEHLGTTGHFTLSGSRPVPAASHARLIATPEFAQKGVSWSEPARCQATRPM